MIVTFILDDWDTAIRVSVIEIPVAGRRARPTGRGGLR